MNKRLLDAKFYENLDEKIKEIIPFNKFMQLEIKNKINCKEYEEFINKVAEAYNFNGNILEKILFFIEKLDLNPEKIGYLIRDCDFIKKYSKNDILRML